jgi:hypothetical protein
VSTRISAVQHVRALRGGSQAHLLRASDGNCYVTKFQNNPQHIRVLANEMLATRLALALGLPMPRVEVIEVCDWLIEHTEALRIQFAGKAIPCRSGKQLGSIYAGGAELTLDYLPAECLDGVRNIADFARALVLDKWTSNADGRQAVFYRSGRSSRYDATFIDQGYCFNAGEWTFPDFPLRGVFANNCVYQRVNGWEAFEPALTRAEEMVRRGYSGRVVRRRPAWSRSAGGITVQSPSPHSTAYRHVSRKRPPTLSKLAGYSAICRYLLPANLLRTLAMRR